MTPDGGCHDISLAFFDPTPLCTRLCGDVTAMTVYVYEYPWERSAVARCTCPPWTIKIFSTHASACDETRNLQWVYAQPAFQPYLPPATLRSIHHLDLSLHYAILPTLHSWTEPTWTFANGVRMARAWMESSMVLHEQLGVVHGDGAETNLGSPSEAYEGIWWIDWETLQPLQPELVKHDMYIMLTFWHILATSDLEAEGDPPDVAHCRARFIEWTQTALDAIPDTVRTLWRAWMSSVELACQGALPLLIK